MTRLTVRHATHKDLSMIAALEAACFPPAEAASAETLCARLAVYPSHFWLLMDENGMLLSFADGMTTHEPILSDEMYAEPQMHTEEGVWQMIFGLNTHPDHRRRGYASYLMRHILAECQADGRAGVVLTCKEELIPFYESLGFVCEGESDSVHGGAVWYDMRVRF